LDAEVILFTLPWLLILAYKDIFLACRTPPNAFLHHLAFFQWIKARTIATKRDFYGFNILKLLGLILYGTFFAEDTYLQLNI